jgi:fumarate reductase subunit C
VDRPAHPQAMQPSKPGSTRTAPPQLPPQFPFAGRYRAYVLFDATGLIYLLLGLLILRAVWALGDSAPAWQSVLAAYRSPAYLLFHAVSLAAVIFVGVRFFRLFPKAQPPRIGPAKPPPRPLIHAALYAVWAGVTILFAAVLAGGIFR